MAVQWLGFCIFTAVTRIPSLVEGLKICKPQSMAQNKKRKKKVGEYLQDLELRKEFLNLIQKAGSTKGNIDTLDF